MFLNTLRAARRPRRGASLTEYGLLVGLVAIVAIVSIEATGTRVSNLLNTTGTALSGVSNTVTGAGSGSESETAGGGTPSTDGAFVLTASTWTGDLGGVSGAHAKCVTELKDTDWLNKADFTTAQIEGARAFLCDSSHNCGDAVASKTYTMAVAGDGTAGGHQFTTDTNAQGPYDAKNWSDADAFGKDTLYWSNHSYSPASGNPWSVGKTYWTNAGKNCGDWNDGTTAPKGGGTGNTNATDENRWAYDVAESENSNGCDIARPLVCIVD